MKALKITLTIILTLFLFHTLRAQLVWNYAAKFEGTNSSYIAVPNTSIYNKNMSSYFLRPVTAECWIYPENASQPEKQIILQKAAGNNPSGFALYLNQGRPSVKVNNVHVFSSVTQVPSQRWSHIAISYDNFSGSWSIYINGILYAQQFYNLNKISNTDSLYIGKGSESPFKGYIDEVRLWARALTATEIGRNFRSTLATYSGFNTNYNVPNDLAPNGVYTNLIISLTFQDDEQVGTIFSMSDWSGCGFNAKNNGVTAMDLGNRPSTTIFQNESIFLIDSTSKLMGADNINNSPSSQITLEVWFYNNDIYPTPYFGFIAKGTDYSLGIANDFTGYNLRGVINGQLMAPVQGLVLSFTPKHKWYHMAFSYNSQNGEYKYYVNGDLLYTGLKPVGLVNNGNDSLRIGIKHKGWIDEVRISDYVKNDQEIKNNLFKSLDLSIHPNPGAKVLNYSFDGYAVSNMGQGGSALYFRGNARFSNPAAIDDVPVSPVNRYDFANFYSDWIMSGYVGYRIPDAGFSGSVTSDIQVTSVPGTIINDINVFVALNHTQEQDLDIWLVSPAGDTVKIFSSQNQLGKNDNIVTIFDDQADSSLVSNRFTSFGPVIQAHKTMNSIFSGSSPDGTWKLLVTDDGSAADFGFLYCWGLQINNGAVVDNKLSQNSQELNTPGKFRLSQNYPNPFNPSTKIEFNIPESGHVKLTVYDILGREVATLVNSEIKEGEHDVLFNAEGLSTGIYFYKIETQGFSDTKKMMLTK